LRYMTELSGPEDVDWIFDCVKTSKEFKTQSKFNNTFYSLQALNLIVESREKHTNKKEFDLHPIVRNYIASEYRGKRERKPYQEGILWVINTFIDRIGKKISIATPISDVYVYIKKSEISIKKEDVATSMSSLLHVAEILIHRGIPGELFRIGEDILEIIERDSEAYVDLDDFHKLAELLGHTYVEYGRKQEAISLVDRYSKMVRKGTAQFVSVCSVACYVYWMLEDYEQAILWGKEGVRLKVEEHIDTNHDSSYQLALAWRDSGNVESALRYFMSGRTVEEILHDDEQDEESAASTLGNIGRCLQIDEDYDAALRFFRRSAQLLESGSRSIDLLNQGYAALWIGEVLEAKGNHEDSYVAYRRSEIVWTKRAPLKLERIKEKVNNVSKQLISNAILNVTESGIERMYRKLIDSK
jgi:tetratricopeptide (TPR) repeat protein